MALIRDFTQKHMERPSLHDKNEASYSVFERYGRVFLVSDGYGRDAREMPGKKSQTIQLDQEGAEVLFGILKHEFHLD